MTTQTTLYADFARLGELKVQASQQDPKALRETAKQFEAIFVQMMLKSMRDASMGDPIFGEQDSLYRDMYDKQIALEMAKGGGIGLGDLLVRQLGGQPEPVAAARAPADAEPVGDGTPEGFVEKLWPLAKKAAASLGIDPRGIVAQAALETGWGRHLIRKADGAAANNLFGIKADGRWDGDRATVGTLEYRGGVPERRHEQFRAYESLEAGVRDYVDFLKSSSRYSTALESGSAQDFARELQRAGYATDPAYAEKINAILEGATMRRALDGLKESGDGTIT